MSEPYESAIDAARCRAGANFATWGEQHPNIVGLCIMEEAGEVARALLGMGSLDIDKVRSQARNLRDEATDLAALCLELYRYIDEALADTLKEEATCD